MVVADKKIGEEIKRTIEEEDQHTTNLRTALWPTQEVFSDKAISLNSLYDMRPSNYAS